MSYFLQNTATYITGGQPLTYPVIPSLAKTVSIAGTPTKMVVLITPVLVILLVLALTQLINRTKVGMAMRAVSRDFETAQLMGVRINTVISVTFVIGSALAAIGSVIIGICENIIKGLPSAWDVSVFSDAFTFALLILVLVFKPTGLFGEKVTDKV